MDKDIAILEEISSKQRSWPYYNAAWLLPSGILICLFAVSPYLVGAALMPTCYMAYVAIDYWSLSRKRDEIIRYWDRQGKDILIASLKMTASASPPSP